MYEQNRKLLTPKPFFFFSSYYATARMDSRSELVFARDSLDSESISRDHSMRFQARSNLISEVNYSDRQDRIQKCETLSLNFSKTIGTNTIRGLLGEFAQLFPRWVRGAAPTAEETFTLEV